MSRVLLIVALCVAGAFADCYLHNPRGSNNRLNEANNNRANGNRLFDSQNNNAGGYNVGPTMYYFVGSRLTVEWTAQHGCGLRQDNDHCELILQYMCDPESPNMRNGVTTDTNEDPEATPDNLEFGKHEPYSFYADCKTRMRNKGLFTADQNLNGNSAIYTRQNPNGQRRGYECPEERDYYPYWHPSVWRDIAIMTDSWGPNSPGGADRCPYYQAESENVKGRGFCKGAPMWNNPIDCARGAANPFTPTGNQAQDDAEMNKRMKAQGVWAISDPFNLAPPECYPAQWSRDNHHGNGIDGYMNTYNWTIPNDVHLKCVFRIRYNISTDDYDGWNINSTWNGAKSPIQDNPTLKDFYGLALALNTDQYGRTFQDRSHIFEIRARPSNVPAGVNIHNINVRGKRGNIVQVYPGVEYDFVPNVALIYPGDYVHFQWTGSNTNPAGNDGEGVAGSDRSNVVQLKANDFASTHPEHALNMDMWMNAKSSKFANALDIAFSLSRTSPMASGGKLNEASPYFDAGLIQMNQRGTYKYLSTRNNNFSNRDQKAYIYVTDQAFLSEGYNMGADLRINPSDAKRSGSSKLSKGGLIAAIVAPIAVVAAAVVGFMIYKKPSSGGSDSYRSQDNAPRAPARI